MYYLLAFVYLTAAHSAASLLLIPVCTHSNGSNLVSLNPNFVTGFSDAESCFFLLDFTPVIQQVIKFKLFSRLVYIIMILHYYLKFKVTLDPPAGKICKHGKNSVYLRVTSSKDLRVIISHFDKYPLSSQKRADYELFKPFELIQNKKHLTADGLKEIVSIKASMNLGLSESLKAVFPNVIPVSRPLAISQKIQDPS